MIVPKEDIESFEEKLCNLEESIDKFQEKISKCILYGMIDITHNIESNIEKLDSEMARIAMAENTPIEEIRDLRLEDKLNQLKSRYYNQKNIFEDGCLYSV
jgi:predicted RNase H-like nuclease (RuvC/YqgF family)